MDNISVIIPVVAGVVVTLLIILWLFSSNYIKVPPNTAAVFSGRKRKLTDGRVVGYRMVKGGAALRIPVLEKVDYLALNVITIPLEIRRAYTLKGVPVSVKAVANVKIKGDDVSLQAAAERFLGMSQIEVQKVIFQTLEGHLRAILGTLTVEEINNDRQSFAQKLTSEAASDLERMGIGVDVLTIQEISDEEGYLDALGKKRTAEVKRDAQIGEAEATRDSKIQASLAMQEGEKVKLDTEANISLAQRDLEVKKAQYQAEVQKERSTAEQSGPLSSAKARQLVVAEEVRVEKIRTQEQIAVQEQEILRREKELEATVVKPADAARTAAVLKAEAAKQAAILEAEGRRASLIAIAEAEQERLRKEGQGRAAAIEAEGKAEAAKIEAVGLAQAKAIEAQGLAEATAIQKKAEAWRQFNEAARLQTILEKLPSILQATAPV
ncbi:MAG TPA: SPFH domain-containing protein, partial [Blastocatellia bacterium]